MIYPTSILSIQSWILLGTVIFLIRYFIHRKWQYLAKLHIPHDPPSILALGHLRTVLGHKNILNIDNEMKEKHGPVWGTYYGLTPYITIHDPDMLRKIMIKEFSSFPNRQKTSSTLKGKEFTLSVAQVQGKTWKRQRATMSPAYTTGKLKEMCSIIENCSDNMMKVLEKKCEKEDGVFTATDLFAKLAMDTICSAAFSTSVHSQDPDQEEPKITIMAKKLFDIKLSPLIILLIIFPWIEKVYDMLGIQLLAEDSFDYFRKLGIEVIHRHKETPQEMRRVDLMSLMLDAEIPDSDLAKEPDKGLIHDEILGNSTAFILAGYLNTSMSMVFLAYNIAQHPDVQKKLQKEIDAVIREKGKLDYEGINSMEYMEMCMNESLRLYSPIYKNMRVCEKEITINGLTIPKGLSIQIPNFALSRDPGYWENPTEFKPERMEDMSQIDNMMFQPFGAGPRNCIGFRFAYLQLKMAMCKILHKYDLLPCDNTPVPPLKLNVSSTVSPAEDFQLRVVLRNT